MKRLFPFFALILLLGTAAKPTDKDAAAFRRPANANTGRCRSGT
ncbi:MAG: hypothetical protein ACLR8Y_11950 [Alistipes indistinctus]